MKIIIPIQSLSDVITNSSSELFATIDGDKEVLEGIYELINRLFGYDQEVEMTPVITMCRRPSLKEIADRFNSDYYSYRCDDDTDIYTLPEKWIEIELPYRLSECKSFFKAGLNAILKENFGDNFKIEYDEEL